MEVIKRTLIKNNKAIIYKFTTSDGYYYIVTRLNFNKKGKRKSMYFDNYEDAKQRFNEINIKL